MPTLARAAQKSLSVAKETMPAKAQTGDSLLLGRRPFLIGLFPRHRNRGHLQELNLRLLWGQMLCFPGTLLHLYWGCLVLARPLRPQRPAQDCVYRPVGGGRLGLGLHIKRWHWKPSQVVKGTTSSALGAALPLGSGLLLGGGGILFQTPLLPLQSP